MTRIKIIFAALCLDRRAAGAAARLGRRRDRPPRRRSHYARCARVKAADLWFCGPVDFGKQLEKDFRNAGLPAADFHEELFHFR